MLQQWGLSDHADAVYRLLLRRPEWDTAKIAAEIGVSETSVEQAVDALVELSLVHRSRGFLRPADPSVALHMLLQRQRADLLHRQKAFVTTEQTVNRLIDEYNRLCVTGARHGYDRLDGMYAVEARLGTLSRQAKRERLAILPGRQATAMLDAWRPVDDLLLGRGVVIHTICQESARGDSSVLDHIRRLPRPQGEIRTAPVLPVWAVIFDREVALVPVDPLEQPKGAVEVFGAGIIAALSALFEQIWHSATPFGVKAAISSEDGVTSQEREVLRLLAQGLTDQRASKMLGIGVRTHRRIVAGLMERLGARSRFEAGVRAAERGWITC
ncbi:helix-turn-helix transcriptional regulator [Spongiactinospora rosea]|uniref:Helix-turn-helix transcriptional regulator n=1 Tax=Spongiactinospora rosea TaxID=2248750 RepID=A0A366LWL7_9ACTN|nr:helix-turn-helix transcriptional regulator [Spongiactinospora rosea]RBQ18346.1 helix-turn-helix transcriptional regulator [Spongiactinospora rosea]